MLTVFRNSTVMGIQDPTRVHHGQKAAFSLYANGQLRGWFVEKKGATPSEDTLVWSPAKKKRAKK